jgi:CDP-paratose 2-epimerase
VTQHRPEVGIVEWFRPGEYQHVEQVLADLVNLDVKYLRTGVSWADWMAPGGPEWYEWLIPQMAAHVEVLPCLLYTPPSLGIAPRTSSPPHDPKAYADFLDLVVNRFGKHFEYVELWNEPNNITEYDWTLDADWLIFCKMVGGAAYWARHLGKKTVLGGMSHVDPHWLRVIRDRGVLEYIDVIGIHGFPGIWEAAWEGWPASIRRVQDVLDEKNTAAKVWITEAGYSTWRQDERGQLREFLRAIDAPAERVYWYAMQDLHPDLPTIDGFHSDDREYFFGLKRVDQTPKLLGRLWAEHGVDGLRHHARLAEPAALPRREEPYALITGGAGFIGTNLAHRLATLGQKVLLYDNLSRPGVERNLQWLQEVHGNHVQIEVADVRDLHRLRQATRYADQVFHLAAQVAVTTSLTDPMHDFTVNVQGTINLLEALRALDTPPSLIFTSTNKVYGSLQDQLFTANDSRYVAVDPHLETDGISEAARLDFHSPYGCSKGAADQYICDYARSFGIPATVFRMSCIYGPHQHGTEDQGWVAHFIIRALEGKPLVIYGDGKQVRDILFVEDLVDAFLLAQANIRRIAGHAFNIGGGPANTISLLELLDRIEELHGRRPAVEFADWRVGDQRYYVSDTRKFQRLTGWMSQVDVSEGVRRLYQWLAKPRRLARAERLEQRPDTLPQGASNVL